MENVCLPDKMLTNCSSFSSQGGAIVSLHRLHTKVKHNYVVPSFPLILFIATYCYISYFCGLNAPTHFSNQGLCLLQYWTSSNMYYCIAQKQYCLFHYKPHLSLIFFLSFEEYVYVQRMKIFFIGSMYIQHFYSTLIFFQN